MGAPQIEPINNGTPSGAPPVAPPNPAAAPAPWYGEIADPELKGYAELKNFTDAPSALKSYRELEKMVGGPKDELLRLPKDAKPEDLNPIYERLGRPKTADEYKFEQVPGADPNFEKVMRPLLHEAGISQASAVKLQSSMNAYLAAKVQADKMESEAHETAEVTKLHQEWPGQTYVEREQMARNFANQILLPALGGDSSRLEEVSNKIAAAIGTATFLKVFANAGEKLSEHKFAGGNQPSANSFGLTPAAAKVRKDELMSNKQWVKRWSEGDKAAAAELDNLQRIQNAGS